MAIEVTFCIRGKETTQALYLQESEWEIPLSRLRKVIEEQSLYVPLEYKFLSSKDNAIALPAEENIVLKDIVSYSQAQVTSPMKEDIETKLEDLGIASETIEKPSSSPKISVTPLKINFSSSSPDNDTAASGTSTTTENEGEGEGIHGNQQGRADDHAHHRNDTNGQNTPGRQQCSSCPYKVFVDFMHGQKGPPNTKSVLKILFLLTFILFSVLATLTLTLHVMVSSFTNLGRSPALVDLFSKLDSGYGEPSQAVTDLEVKLSQLEVSSKYEINQLTSRLAELEDLYLRDLAIHKKELNMIKKQIMMDNDVFMEEEMNDFEETGRNFERNNKEPKRKPSVKINERNKG